MDFGPGQAAVAESNRPLSEVPVILLKLHFSPAAVVPGLKEAPAGEHAAVCLLIRAACNGQIHTPQNLLTTEALVHGTVIQSTIPFFSQQCYDLFPIQAAISELRLAFKI